MSWSVILIGNPDNIVKALQQNSEKLNGTSKDEFDAALPHLIGLVKENSNKTQQPVLKLSASGHGYLRDSEFDYKTCQVLIEDIGGLIV